MTSKHGFAIQLNCSSDAELLETQMALREIGVEPIFFGIIPFTTQVTGTEEFANYDKVFIYGSVRTVDLCQQGYFPPNGYVLYDTELFDQLFYSKIIPTRLLLNGQAIFETFSNLKDHKLSEPKFVKPSKDLKCFPGMIVPAGMSIGDAIFSKQLSSDFSENPDNVVIIIAPLSEIKKEFRNFVVDGEIIDSSVYKIGSKITYEIPTAEEREQIRDFFNELKTHYEPHGSYVADFALLEDGSWKLIEYNCINCAGMYAVDRRKVFKAILDAE